MYPALTFHTPEDAYHMRQRFMCMVRNRKLQENDYLRHAHSFQLNRALYLPPLRCPCPIRPDPIKPALLMYNKPEDRVVEYIDLPEPRAGNVFYQQLRTSINNVADKCREPYFVGDLDHDNGSLPSNALSPTNMATAEPMEPGINSPDLKRSFSCPHCKYTTDRKNNLKRHIITMHFDCDRKLECCGANFRSKAKLREHVILFHKDGYRCLTCNRIFCRKALLRRHMAVHSGRKDFLCSQCDYATSHKSNLERHQKVHLKSKGSQRGGDEITNQTPHRKYARRADNSNALRHSLAQERNRNDDETTDDGLKESPVDKYTSMTLMSDEHHTIDVMNYKMGCEHVQHEEHFVKGGISSSSMPFYSKMHGYQVNMCTCAHLFKINGECADCSKVDENCNSIVTDRVDVTSDIHSQENSGDDTHEHCSQRTSSELTPETTDTRSDMTDEHTINDTSLHTPETPDTRTHLIDEHTINDTSLHTPETPDTRTHLIDEHTINDTSLHTLQSPYKTHDMVIDKHVTDNKCGQTHPFEHQGMAVRGLKTNVLPCIDGDDKENVCESIPDNKPSTVHAIKDTKRLCVMPYRCASCRNRYKTQTDFLCHVCDANDECAPHGSGPAFSLVAKIIKMGSV